MPDVVIADLRMPNLNGIEFCRLLRKNENTEDTDILVASAYLSAEIKEELKKLGVNIILEKPVRLAALIAAIVKCAGLKLK
jgi:CheY-like chemotaxis protein